MGGYQEKLNTVLYATYRLGSRMPGDVSNKNIEICLEKNHPTFNIGETDAVLKGLEDQGFIKRHVFMNGNAGGYVTLNSFGVEIAEEYEMSLKPNLSEITKNEAEVFLTRCCEEVEFEIQRGLDAYAVGKDLGFDQDKSDRYYRRLKAGGYLEDIGINRTSIADCMITSKALDAVQGPMFNQPEGITLNSSEVNFHGDVNHSNVATGDGNIQSISITQEQKTSIQEFVQRVRSDLPELRLGEDEEFDCNAHLDSIDGLLKGNPEPNLLKKELRSIWRIIENCASNVLSAGFVQALTSLAS